MRDIFVYRGAEVYPWFLWFVPTCFPTIATDDNRRVCKRKKPCCVGSRIRSSGVRQNYPYYWGNSMICSYLFSKFCHRWQSVCANKKKNLLCWFDDSFLRWTTKLPPCGEILWMICSYLFSTSRCCGSSLPFGDHKAVEDTTAQVSQDKLNELRKWKVRSQNDNAGVPR